MIVVPRTAFLAAGPDTIKVVLSELGELVLECEATSPRSAKGRAVYVRVPAEQVPALLKAARSTAIAAGRRPM